MKKSEEETTDASDKGWAWIVLGAAFTNSMLLAGYMQGIGVFFVEWQDSFAASAGDVGWIGVIIGFCTAVGALMGGALATRFTCQKIIVLFGLVMAASLFGSSFAATMWQLYITNFISGLCLGLCLQPGWTAIGYNFNRWLGLANGISSAGVGLGIVALPPLYQFFADILGWRGAIQVTGAMMVMCSVCGILIRPTEKEYSLLQVRVGHKAVKKDKRRQRCSVTLPTGVVIVQVSLFERLVRRPVDTFMDNTGLKLLIKYPRFLVVCLTNALVGYSYYSGMVFFQSKVVYDNGIHKFHAAFLTSAIGVGSIVGRIGSGFLVDFKVLSPRVLYGLSNLSCALFSFANPFVGTYPLLLAISIWFGLFSGLSYSLVIYCCRLCVPAENVSSSIGIVLLAEGFGVLFGVFFMGLVRDLTSDYSMSFIMCGGVFVLSGLVIILDSVYVGIEKRRLKRTPAGDVDDKGLDTIPEADEPQHTGPGGFSGNVNLGFAGGNAGTPQRRRKCGVATISIGGMDTPRSARRCEDLEKMPGREDSEYGREERHFVVDVDSTTTDGVASCDPQAAVVEATTSETDSTGVGNDAGNGKIAPHCAINVGAEDVAVPSDADSGEGGNPKAQPEEPGIDINSGLNRGGCNNGYEDDEETCIIDVVAKNSEVAVSLDASQDQAATGKLR